MAYSRVLTREDVENAIKHTHSNLHAARFLGINKVTWKKYAKMFTDKDGVTLYDKHSNRYGLGITDKNRKSIKPPTIMDVISGKIPARLFKANDLKSMIVGEGLLQEQCSCCGFHEERITDHKVPLMITFRNLNKKDWSLDNLELLCYNCYFLQVGDIFTRQQMSVIDGTHLAVKHEDNLQEVLSLSEENMKRLEELWNGTYVPYTLDGEDLISRR